MRNREFAPEVRDELINIGISYTALCEQTNACSSELKEINKGDALPNAVADLAQSLQGELPEYILFNVEIPRSNNQIAFWRAHGVNTNTDGVIKRYYVPSMRKIYIFDSRGFGHLSPAMLPSFDPSSPEFVGTDVLRDKLDNHIQPIIKSSGFYSLRNDSGIATVDLSRALEIATAIVNIKGSEPSSNEYSHFQNTFTELFIQTQHILTNNGERIRNRLLNLRNSILQSRFRRHLPDVIPTYDVYVYLPYDERTYYFLTKTGELINAPTVTRKGFLGFGSKETPDLSLKEEVSIDRWYGLSTRIGFGLTDVLPSGWLVTD